MSHIMIPTDREELDVLAGEYVLGLLDAAQTREVADALANNRQLRDAVSFWEQKLHPLSALAAPADPPLGTWDAIAARLQTANPPATSWWNGAAPWKWATAGLAAAAAALVLYIASPNSAPQLVAGLHPPNQEAANWVVTTGPTGLSLLAVSPENPPPKRVFELWASVKPGAPMRAIGVIPADGELRVAVLPRDLGPGATIAISVEPPGGSPTGLPTGPVAFIGVLRAS
jgi:anti-sigma-K factor RskA